MSKLSDYKGLTIEGDNFSFDPLPTRLPEYKKGGGIYIKPSKRGSLREALGTPEGKNIPASDLEIKSGDSPAMRKKKIFAQNARKWKHEDGGRLITNDMFETGGELKQINNFPFEQTQLTQPQFQYEDGGILYGSYGDLPEHSFGSWLGDNAGKILKTAGGIVTAIPPIGPILGPALIGAGYATDAIVGAVRNKREAEEQQEALDEKAAAQQQEQRIANRGQRQANLVDQTVNYGATFEDGGQIGQGMMEGNPQIVEYNNGGKHDESATRGIPVDAKGNPATTSNQSAVGLTEEGEVTWNGYVFSDKLKS